jgi:hypothetical protein
VRRIFTVAQASDSKVPTHPSGVIPHDINFTGLARSIDVYLDKPLAVLIGSFGKTETVANRERRVRKFLPFLSHDVIRLIAKSHRDDLKRLSNCIEAINDCLMFSSFEGIRQWKNDPDYRKLITWAYSLAAYGGSDRVCKQWKKFSVLVRWKGLRSMTDPPERPDDFPGFGAQREYLYELPPMWRRLCPWLSRVWDRGVETKAEATRLSHLVTGRNFPAGDKRTREESLRKHAETLVKSPPVVSHDREEILRRLSYLFGSSVKALIPDNFRSLGHLSLTSSASLDSPVKEGGRAAEVALKFKTWALRVSDRDESRQTWNGDHYLLVKGRPIWQTMCRPEAVGRPEDVFGESAENMILDFENFKYEDPLYGLDSTTGKQLLQWAIEECLSNNILEGTKYKSDVPLTKGPTAPSIRASAVGEPGAKSRVVTVGEDCLTIVLQPFAHHFLGIAKLHPSVRAGLTRGWQLYEWVKGLRNAGPVPRGETYFLSSDLTAATDWCSHEYSRAMLEGFVEGLDQNSPYVQSMIELLCSPRTYESPGEAFDCLTSRGILMGDPGAKLVLTLHNICAEAEAMFCENNDAYCDTDAQLLAKLRVAGGIQTRIWRHFACSGDDHVGQGPKRYLQRITLNHSRNGMMVSWSQNFLSKLGAFYCEEMLLTVGLRDSEIWGEETPLHKRDYLRTPHIDAMKVRLFSPCAKEHEGKDEPNPAIGKARQVQGMLAWLGGGFEAMKVFASARFEQRMERFLPTQLGVRYLPVKLGGIGAPAFHRSKTELRQAFRSLSEDHRAAISILLRGDANPQLQRTLANFATNARARGVSLDAVQEQVKEVLSNAELVLGIDDSDLQLIAGYPDVEWSHLRFYDKVDIAKRYKFVSIDDALNVIDRPYLFRNMLCPEISLRHGEDPYKDRAYDTLPWKVREKRLEENILKCLESYPGAVSPGETTEVCDKLASWASENSSLDIPKAVYFLPESVVVSDTLCTLRTPLT